MSNQDDNDDIYTHADTIGYIRKDSFGRVYIDTCPTDEEHSISPVPTGQERRNCRKYLDDILLLPDAALGKRVRIQYEIYIERYKDN